MGRELRMVPPNWQHPRYTYDDAPSSHLVGEYIGLCDGYEKGLEEFAKAIETKGLAEAIEYYGGGPRKEDYVDYQGQAPTWYQIYETVSEGTPVTPPFATPEELVDYLVKNGDFWDQERGHGGYTYAQAHTLVVGGYAPSGLVVNGVFYDSKQSLDHLNK